MRSVVVVLPASIWAMIPMLRTLARSTPVLVATVVLASSRRQSESAGSPAVVGEGLVGLRHLVRVLALLDRRAEAVARVEQLVHQPLGHGLLATLAGVEHQPAQREGGGAGGPHLHRDLVGRATDTAAAHLQGR